MTLPGWKLHLHRMCPTIISLRVMAGHRCVGDSPHVDCLSFRACLQITRNSPDLRNLTILGQISPALADVALSSGLSPLYRGGTFFYALFSPFVVPSMAFQAIFAVNDSTTLDVNGGQREQITSGVRSKWVPLAVQPAFNIFTFTSTVDGNYSINVRHTSSITPTTNPLMAPHSPSILFSLLFCSSLFLFLF